MVVFAGLSVRYWNLTVARLGSLPPARASGPPSGCVTDSDWPWGGGALNEPDQPSFVGSVPGSGCWVPLTRLTAYWCGGSIRYGSSAVSPWAGTLVARKVTPPTWEAPSATRKRTPPTSTG